MGILKEHSGGKYLRSEDIDGIGKEFGTVDTITDITEADVSRQDDDESEIKPIIHFETLKPLVCNATNLGFLTGRFGVDDKKVIGNKVLVWVDDSVRFRGKAVKGLRLADPREKGV